ncbi:MAG: type III-B CRISPR module RAMP protein Cmr6 [Verrucomicrobiales bacterium]|nr:type III-B CRISPR module RAMP protein Cmr6 [Verrucomicrobiales bacterium]
MSTFTLKLNAAKQSASWQLALDKYPFNLGKPNSPSLTEPDDRGKEQSIKPRRLREVRDRYTAAKPSLDAAAKRQQDFLAVLARQHGPRFRRVTLVNSSRLLLHLGRSSVLENVGLHCDRTTGLPVIPGTAVKGVISTWACWVEHFNDADGSFREFIGDSVQRRHFTQAESRLAAAIFGDNSASGSTAAGEVVFLGAFPTTPPVLELDIVTPHTDAAGHDRNPVPNPFLAIAPGTEWSFAFLANTRDGSQANAFLDQTAAWLSESLEQSGIGAKTAAGYGRFLVPEIWQSLTLDEAAKQALATKQEKESAAAERLAASRASTVGEFSNETDFQNRVLARLNKPGEYQVLQTEVQKIESNPANAPWIEKITAALRENKDARKRLKDKDWFPKTWLPQ